MYIDPNLAMYMQQYGQQYGQYQQQPKQEVVKVNGENGARAYPIGANSSALLLDESGVIVWLVVTDGAGYKTCKAYDIAPHEEAPTPDYNTLEQRIERLEGLIINGNTSDTTTARNENSTAEPGYRADPKAYERSEECEGRRSSYEANDRKQSSIPSGVQRYEGTGRHAQGSVYEQSKGNGNKRE